MSEPGGLSVAAWQCASRPLDAEGNLARLASAARRAAALGADVLVTPELFVTGYDIGVEDTRRLAEPRDGRYAERVAEITRETGTAIAYGYPERAGDSVFNAAQLVDAGRVVLDHRKLHLFGDLDGQRFLFGDGQPSVADLRGTPTSLLVCYDVEFPESTRAAALAGAELVLVPTANMVGFEAVSELLVPARAYENGFTVAYANYVGAEGSTQYAGLSVVAAPDPSRTVTASAHDEVLLVAAVSSAGAGPDYLGDLRP